MPDEILAKVYETVKRVAIALRESYEGCSGTSTRQHNEPDGNQDVWHFHVHVFPRYKNDKLYVNHEDKRYIAPEERRDYAITLRNALDTLSS